MMQFEQASEVYDVMADQSKLDGAVQVTQKDGFFCTIRLAAILELPPDEAFALLARPGARSSVLVKFEQRFRCSPNRACGSPLGATSTYRNIRLSKSSSIIFVSRLQCSAK